MSRSADIDKMVSGFLSELDALYDSLESGKTRKDTARPGVPYRNIDILLMNDDRAKTRAGLAATEPVLRQTVARQSLSKPHQRLRTFWSRCTSYAASKLNPRAGRQEHKQEPRKADSRSGNSESE